MCLYAVDTYQAPGEDDASAPLRFMVSEPAQILPQTVAKSGQG